MDVRADKRQVAFGGYHKVTSNVNYLAVIDHDDDSKKFLFGFANDLTHFPYQPNRIEALRFTSDY